MMNQMHLFGREIPLHRCGTLVIGTGCAGFNAADTLYDLGYRDILLVSEGVNMGTSRNTGSDKQTYYKLAVQAGEADNVVEMARALASGGDVHGDVTYAEAVNSIRAFMKLVHLGVPFPTNEYGEFVGYQTDHTSTKRATSAGPLTSRYMTECLEAEVLRKGVTLLDGMMIVELLVDSQGIYGALGIDRQNTAGPNRGFHLFLSDNIIVATGGPAAVYLNRVYPPSQTGMSGMLLEAGVQFANFQEWQYGIASKTFRWNLSGTYQQVLPRYVSMDDDGEMHEFLPEYFDSALEALNLVFLKGYQWPFDSAKINASSMVDLAVYREETLLGRKVFLDYSRNPIGLEDGFGVLSKEAFSYLENSGALLPTPIERLRKMNPDAIALYQSHGIDLEKELLPITIAAQHCNGGAEVDVNWQTNIPGLYVVGEAAGTFGAYRPGGSALNSCQVGSLRAAEHIAASGRSRKVDTHRVERGIHVCRDILELSAGMPNPKKVQRIAEIASGMSGKMSAFGAHIRDGGRMNALREEIQAALRELEKLLLEIPAYTLPKWFKTRDQLVTQSAMIDVFAFSETALGSHGGAICCEIREEDTSAKEFLREIQTSAKRSVEVERGRLVIYHLAEGVRFEPVRPIPKMQDWFENVWADYKKRAFPCK